MKEQIPYAERTYLAVPYDERREAKAIGARWDAVKKAWYVGPGVEPEKIAKWEIRHQQAATLDPRAEFAEVLRGLGAAVEGEHPIMNGERQRIRAENDKRGVSCNTQPILNPSLISQQTGTCWRTFSP